jgi:two pore calcium channel protein 1
MKFLKDAYAKICGEFARAYFMIFYLVILVILTIVVSFILDAFAAIDSEQKQAAETKEKVGSSKTLTLTLTSEDLLHSPSSNPENNTFVYVGKRRRTKDDLSLKLYADDIPGWIAEYEAESKRLGTLDVDKLQLKRQLTASSDRNSMVDMSLDIM